MRYFFEKIKYFNWVIRSKCFFIVLLSYVVLMKNIRFFRKTEMVFYFFLLFLE